MDGSGTLDELIGRARHRHVFQHLIRHVALAGALVFGCVILVLLLGTYILNPYWLVLVFCVSLGLSWYRSRKQLLSRYQVAQALDRRLNLNDSLSTAIHFKDIAGGTRIPGSIVESQRTLAEQQARSADLRAGLPLVAPKTVYTSAFLGVLAVAIFGVRYGVTHSLDLRPALVTMPFSGSLGPDEIAANKKKAGQKPGRKTSQEDALSYDPWESKVLDQTGAPDSALNTIETPDVNGAAAESPANAKANNTPAPDGGQEPGESAENGERSASGKDQPGSDMSAPDQDGGAKSGKQSAAQDNQNGSNPGESSSLSEKMRDALANLMSKLKMNQKPGEGKPGSQQGQNGAQSAKQRGKDEKGSQTPGKPQADGMSSPDAQGDQEGQSSDKAQSAQNKSAKGSDKPQSQDGKSGIGKQDGDKSAREAEQLAAMGKISEIIGKRSATMTGEVMVEVASGKQQLKTQYSQKRAAHTEAGGEINRDEVPLAYQHYVQQYFEEIRKTPAPAKPKKPAGL